MGTLSLKPSPIVAKKIREIKKKMLPKAHPKGRPATKAEQRAELMRVRRERRKRILATRQLLVDTFPALFAPKGANKLPLMVGIDDAVLEAMPEMSRTRLNRALRDYTRGQTYLRNVVEGSARYGLDGSVVGVVTAKEAAHAAERLAKMRAEKTKLKTDDS